MNEHDVIIKPIITEQTMHFANEKNAYSFEVNKLANKAQIRNAVEKLYNVQVVDVRTANKKGKMRRRGKNMGMTSSWKKAIVVLNKEHHIDLF